MSTLSIFLGKGKQSIFEIKGRFALSKEMTNNDPNEVEYFQKVIKIRIMHTDIPYMCVRYGQLRRLTTSLFFTNR